MQPTTISKFSRPHVEIKLYLPLDATDDGLNALYQSEDLAIIMTHLLKLKGSKRKGGKKNA